MSKKNIAIRTFAFIMSLVLFVYFTPVQAIRASGDVTADVSKTGVLTPEEVATIVCEDTSLREENIKHFVLSNHTYRAVVYSTPVHYLKDGEWVDIDNTLTAQSSLFEGDFDGQITTSGPFQVKFANNVNSSKLVRIDKDGYRLSWGYQSNTKQKSSGKIKASVESGDTIRDAVSGTSSVITYDNVEQNASLEYEVTPTGVKENIIVYSAADTYTYTFEFKTKGVSLRTCEDGSIEVVADDTDEAVFVIPAPYMMDAAGRYSEAVSYSLSNIKNNKATLTVTADASWINSADTQFPVIIDPVITTEQTRDDIKSAFVASGYAGTNCGGNNYSLLSVGRDSAGPGKTRTLIKFKTPDELGKGNMVIRAEVNMLMWSSSNGTGTKQPISAHAITELWDAEDVTWNHQPTFNSTVLDYAFIPTTTVTQSTAKWISFDVTGEAKNWIGGSANNGIMIKADDENAYARCWFNSERYTPGEDFTYRYPIIAIDYRNNNGLEDYWTYTSAAAGSAGTARVNDYTGNLVFSAPLFTSPSELMPLTLTATYNGYASEKMYVAGKNNSSKTVIGRGWRLNVHQTLLTSDKFGLSGSAQERYPYVYTDADGTDHYFVKTTENGKTVYLDEDGLGLTLTIDSDATDWRYYITDKKDNVLIFNATGNLRRIQNANGQRIGVVYQDDEVEGNSSKRISCVVDGTNHKYTFHYSGTDNVQYIADHYDRRVHFTRASNGVLTNIHYPDGTSSTFTYESSAEDDNAYSMLKAIDDFGYQLRFTYTSKKTGKRVSTIKEFSAPNAAGTPSLGQTISFDRSKYNTTVIRTAGSDDIYGTDDDILTTCQFDNAGRLTSTHSKTADGSSIGASTALYTGVFAKDSTPTVSDLNRQNRLVSSGSFGRNTTNWLTNANFESSLSGWTDNDVDVTSSFDVVTDEAYFGQKSAKITNTAVSASAGRSVLMQNISGLSPSATYTFSAYVKTENIAKVYTGSRTGAFISVATQDSATSVSAFSETISEDTNTALDNGWKRLTATITLPEGCTSVRVYIQLRDVTGTMYVDGVQFERGRYPLPVNLLENAGFDKFSSGMPTSWTATAVSYTTSDGTVKEGVTTEYQKNRTHSFRMIGEAEKDKYLSQTIPVSGDPNETYIISGWAGGHAILPTNHENARFEISVSVKYRKSDGTYRTESKPAAQFNPTITGWQYAAQTFAIVSSSNSADTPVSITIRVRFSDQANAVYFDNLQLLRDNTNTYTYDDEGNMISVSASAAEKSTMNYDGSDLISVTDSRGYAYEYTYDDNHNVLTATSAGDVTTKFTYESDTGLVSSVSVKNSDGDIGIKESLQYSSKNGSIQPGSKITAVIDQHGQSTDYTYDDKERLSSVEATNDIFTYYSYVSEEDDKVASVTVHDDDKALTSVQYLYDGNRLSSLTYGDDTYTFNVDRYGNATSTTINGVALSTSTYGARNGKLASVSYGNGFARSYEYNWLGQLLAIRGGGQYLYSYGYDNNGALREFIDHVSGRKTSYMQDSLGRMVSQQFRTTADDYLGAVEYGYDGRNNVNRLVVNFGGHTHTAQYLHTAVSGVEDGARFAADNLPTQYKYSATRHATYEYTTLNLLKKRTFSTTTPLVNEYEYYPSELNTDGSRQYQTNQLKSETINGIMYQYSYDLAGNIISIEKGTSENNLVNYREYSYDSLSQLVEEIHYDSTGTATKTTTYDYDEYGNILSRTVNGQTVNYTYGTDADAGWSKLLKSYNGQSIDYDAIGNPLSYRGATMTWTNGRSLASYAKDGVSISYTYDDTGMRTTKTVNGAKSEYLYVDGVLMGEIRDGHHIHYSYDSYGKLSVIKYYTNDTDYYIYYVMTNAQGDVISLHNANGATMVTYEYDAWGNLLSMTDNTGVGIGTINPFRYRGYYYDTETGLYYLASRYYDPQVGRFINADGYTSTGQGVLGYNAFAYCGNNPVMACDPSGCWSWGVFAAVATAVVAVTALVIVSVAVVGEVNNGIKNYNELEEPEKEVAKKDPIGAVTAHQARNVANDYQKELYPDIYTKDDNQSNAFKHAMWNAVMTDMMGEERATTFANAHEEYYLNLTPESCQMDLHNNALGRQIALEYSGQGYDVFAEKIQEAIERGDAYVIRWD